MLSIDMNTGLAEADREVMATELSKLLADTFGLYVKTHGYHWNVRGATFASLHALFEGQYQELWAAIDAIAERIRSVGELAPQSYAAFGNLSGIRDGDPTRDATEMVAELRLDHETVLATLRKARGIAEGFGDEATIDLLNARSAAHDKHAWMLRATLGAK